MPDDKQNQNQPAGAGKPIDETLGETQVKREQCEKLRDEYLDGWKRAKADLINYKKEEAQRIEQFIKFSNEQILQELVSVLDSFDLGMAALKDNDEALAGVRLIKNQFEDLLKRYGLECIEVKAGDTFDPSRHEAVGEEESEKPPNVVVKEVGRGYTLHDKVIRPARVKVSKSN